MQSGVAIYALDAKLRPEEVRLLGPDFKKLLFFFDFPGLRLVVLPALET